MKPTTSPLAAFFALALSLRAADLPPPAEAETQFQSAKTLIQADNPDRDPMKAFVLMKQAADQGYAEAESGLGFLYSAGIGTPRNDSQAVVWLKKAADKGVAKAEYNLGRMLLAGRGIPKDEKAAFQWIDRASQQGLLEAQLFQGEALYFGEHGQAVDYPAALVLLKKAADAGSANAQNTVGVILRDGKVGTPDWVAAEACFRKAAEQGHARAQSNLGVLLARTPKEGAERIEALKWLMVADQRGEITAQKLLGEILVKVPQEEVAEARKQAASLPRTNPKL